MTPYLAGAWLNKELNGRRNRTRDAFMKAMSAIEEGHTVCISRDQYKKLTKEATLWKAQRIIRKSKQNQIEK